MAYTSKDDWTGDAHFGKDEVHYRLYMGGSGNARKPTTICVQWFDYFDYDARFILSPDAWDTEAEAERALVALAPTIDRATRTAGKFLAPGIQGRAVAELVRNSPTGDSADESGDPLPPVEVP